jgi:uncharacterized membrane protein
MKPILPSPARSWLYSVNIRVAVAATLGVVASLALMQTAYSALALLWGWDLTAIVYIAWIGIALFRLDASKTGALASSEEPDRLTSDLLMLLASVASLAAVVIGLTRASDAHGVEKTLQIVTCVSSVVLSWALVHCTFTLRYAMLYYNGPKGGIDFHSDDDPCYFDFAYIAFTVGMTFQVSDTDIHSRQIRRAVLRHALLSYVFGTVIVATMVSVVAGLGK